MQDEELLHKIRIDPNKGLGILTELYAGIVYSVVRSKLSKSIFCDADIENCVADVFSEFYFDLDKYDIACGSIRSWFCVIAGHNATDILRKYYRQNNTEPLNDEFDIQLADEFSIEDDIENNELRSVIMEEIVKLGEPDHEIIVRKFYLQQSSKEIAMELNMTVSNIDTRTHRALKKLRKIFGGNIS